MIGGNPSPGPAAFYRDVDGVWRLSRWPDEPTERRESMPVMASLMVEARKLKVLREALCRTTTDAPRSHAWESGEHDLACIVMLLDEIDRHRPVDSSGVHGVLHTATCGCEDGEVGEVG